MGLVQESSVCFNVVLSLLGLQYKVESCAGDIRTRFSSVFQASHAGPRINRGGEPLIGVGTSFCAWGQRSNISKIESRVPTFLQTPCLSFLLVLLLKASSICSLAHGDLSLNNHYTNIYGSEGLGLSHVLYFQIYAHFNILYGFLMSYKS